MQDTVEVQVKGLAEQIIAEDEKIRAQELVRFISTFLLLLLLLKSIDRMCLISLQNDQTGI